MKNEALTKAALVGMTAGLLYLGYYLGDKAAEPTRQIMAALQTRQANGALVIDHCNQNK